MLHAMRGVLLALLSAEPAGRGAGLKGRSHHLRVERRLTRDDAAGRGAKIGAIEVEPNAPGESFGIDLA
jgi:hypothetical protein